MARVFHSRERRSGPFAGVRMSGFVSSTVHDPHAGSPEHGWDLDELAHATRLCDWMFEETAAGARGRVAEVGAGIGTFSERLAARGVDDLVLIEPDPACVAVLERRFGARPNVTVSGDEVPGSSTLAEIAGTRDFLLCQNVLEHIDDHQGAMREMADALAPGGRLALLVPAHPALYGSLDRQYGHFRRYSKEVVSDVVRGAGLELDDLYSFNLLGV